MNTRSQYSAEVSTVAEARDWLEALDAAGIHDSGVLVDDSERVFVCWTI